MNLLDTSSVWVFISGSDEDRFLDDIAFGIACLLHRGFPISNVLVFVDQPSGSGFLSAYNFPQGINVQPTNQLASTLKTKQMSHLTLVITGHGDQLGISASPAIKPFELMGIVRSLDGLESSLIVLGQCYAGIFNYLEARSQSSQDGTTKSAETCIVGATGLTVSVSVSVDLSNNQPFSSFTSCNKQWSANLFLLFFMCGICVPTDIDGDGSFTVTDAYKFAGIFTNQRLLELKQQAFQQVFSSVLSDVIASLTPTPVSQQLAQKAKQDLIASADTVLNSQTPWILNAHLARKMLLG